MREKETNSHNQFVFFSCRGTSINKRKILPSQKSVKGQFLYSRKKKKKFGSLKLSKIKQLIAECKYCAINHTKVSLTNCLPSRKNVIDHFCFLIISLNVEKNTFDLATLCVYWNLNLSNQKSRGCSFPYTKISSSS